jgi:hypothetical protein
VPISVHQLATILEKLEPYEKWDCLGVPVERYQDSDHYAVGPPLHGTPQCPRSATEAATLLLRWLRHLEDGPNDRPIPARYSEAMRLAKLPRPAKRPPHPQMNLPPWIPPAR